MTSSALLTGISGFIGERLAQRLLAEGWTVHAIVRPSSDLSGIGQHPALQLHAHDGSTEGLLRILKQSRPDTVFHLASLYLTDHRPEQVEPLIRSNLLFPAQLMEAMAATGACKLVNTGTAWQHYEGETYRPVNLYAATKQAMQDLAAYYADAKGLSVLTLKLFDTYGACDKRRKLISILVDAARTGEHLDMSPGDQIVDLSHVDDVVNAFLIAAERLKKSKAGSDEIYFVSGERLTVRELVGRVEQCLGRKLDVSFGGRPYRDREVMEPVETSAGNILPEWWPEHSLDAGIAELLG